MLRRRPSGSVTFGAPGGHAFTPYRRLSGRQPRCLGSLAPGLLLLFAQEEQRMPPEMKLVENNRQPMPARARREGMAYAVGFVALVATPCWIAFLGWALVMLLV